MIADSHREVHAFELRAGKIDPFDMGIRQIRPAEIGAPERGSFKISINQVRIGEIRLIEANPSGNHAIAKLSVRQIYSRAIRTLPVDARVRRTNPRQVGIAKRGTTEVVVMHDCAAEVRIGEIGTLEIKAFPVFIVEGAPVGDPFLL